MMCGCEAVRDRIQGKRVSGRRRGRTYVFAQILHEGISSSFPLSELEDMPVSPYRSPRVVRLLKRALS